SRPGGDRRESEPGRPPTGGRARDPPQETPRVGTPDHPPTRRRRRLPLVDRSTRLESEPEERRMEPAPARRRIIPRSPPPSPLSPSVSAPSADPHSIGPVAGGFRGIRLESCHVNAAPVAGRAARDGPAVHGGSPHFRSRPKQRGGKPLAPDSEHGRGRGPVPIPLLGTTIALPPGRWPSQR